MPSTRGAVPRTNEYYVEQAGRQAKYVMKFFQDLFTSVGGSHEKFRSSGGGKDVVIKGYREEI